MVWIEADSKRNAYLKFLEISDLQQKPVYVFDNDSKDDDDGDGIFKDHLDPAAERIKEDTERIESHQKDIIKLLKKIKNVLWTIFFLMLFAYLDAISYYFRELFN